MKPELIKKRVSTENETKSQKPNPPDEVPTNTHGKVITITK